MPTGTSITSRDLTAGAGNPEGFSDALAYHSRVVYQAPRGTQDILPEDEPYWTLVDQQMRHQARLANYGEIRTPTFEETGVFARGVGAR